MPMSLDVFSMLVFLLDAQHSQSSPLSDAGTSSMLHANWLTDIEEINCLLQKVKSQITAKFGTERKDIHYFDTP